jgi:phosphate uptake regulator
MKNRFKIVEVFGAQVGITRHSKEESTGDTACIDFIVFPKDMSLDVDLKWDGAIHYTMNCASTEGLLDHIPDSMWEHLTSIEEVRGIVLEMVSNARDVVAKEDALRDVPEALNARFIHKAPQQVQ